MQYIVLHCWTFQPKDAQKKPLQKEVEPEYLRPQWDQLNQRSRWYTQQTWQGPFAFITVASIGAYNLAKTDGASLGIQALGFFLLSALGFAVGIFLRYIGQGADSSIRQTMRIELHPKFLRTSALEGARDPGGFTPLMGLRQHRVIAVWIVWLYFIVLLFGSIWFTGLWLIEIFNW